MYIYVYTKALITSLLFVAVVVSVTWVNTDEWGERGAEGRGGVMKGSARMRKAQGYGRKWERQRERKTEKYGEGKSASENERESRQRERGREREREIARNRVSERERARASERASER